MSLWRRFFPPRSGPLAHTPGPSPWFLRGGLGTLRSSAGALVWRPASASGDEASISALTRPDGAVLGLLHFYCWVRPLAGARFLVWTTEPQRPQQPIEEPTFMVLRVYDADHLLPVPQPVSVATTLLRSGDRVHFSVPPMVEVRLPTSLGAGTHAVPLPAELAELEELLVLTHGTSSPLRSDFYKRMQVELWRILPRAQQIAVYPQDWYNDGDFDFGYVWITRVAREPGTGAVVGEGIRMDAFRLDATLRQREAWLRPSPFAIGAPAA